VGRGEVRTMRKPESDLEDALRAAHATIIERERQLLRRDSDVWTLGAEVTELRQRLVELRPELRTALEAIIGALQFAKLKSVEVENELQIPGLGEDPELAQVFVRLRVELSRAEHAACTKLNGETK